MNDITLSAQPREETGSDVIKIRRSGVIPAVVYGPQHESTNIQMADKDFDTIYKQAGTSSLVDLVVGESKPTKVLIHEIQKHPVSGDVLHVDFYQVDMKKKTTADVELKFINQSPAVKEQGGVLIRNMKTVTIECLPQHLVHDISVDISILKSFDDIIRVSDLPVPEGVEIVDEGNIVVAGVQKPRTEAELEALEAEPAGEEAGEVEKVGDEEKEGDEEAPAEGEGAEKPAADKKEEKKEGKE